MPLRNPFPKEVMRGNVVFLFAGIILTVLLAALVLQQMSAGFRLPSGASFTEIRPDVAMYLPSGTQWNEQSLVAVEEPAAVVPSYVVGYIERGRVSAVLLRWDVRARTFVSAGIIAVDSRSGAPSVPELSVASLGAGRPSAIIVSRMDATLPAPHRASTVLLVDANGLRTAVWRDVDGVESAVTDITVPALRILDVSGDGLQDLLADHGDDVVDVYEWKDDVFAYSERLSWAMATSRRLFPEPPSAVAPEIDAGAVAE